MAERVAVLIGEKLNSLKQRKRQPFGGVRSLAEILNYMEPATSTELLSGLTQTNSQLAGSVRGLMFTFDEFKNISANGLRELTSKLDRKMLMTSLKGTSHPLRQHFMSTMSPRAGGNAQRRYGGPRPREDQGCSSRAAADYRARPQVGRGTE